MTQTTNKKADPVIITIIGATLLFLTGGLIWAMKSPANPTSATIQENTSTSLSLPQTNFDWGDIPISDGNVTKDFSVTNTGSSDLTLANFVTSCMCTNVKLTTSNGSSPLFGMHSKSNYQGIIKPGETATVTVIFDPAFHGPQGKGQVTRIIRFDTNDPNQPQVELTLTGTVI